MSLIVLTGAVRSGKSAMAEQLAASRDRDVVVAVAGWDGDEEMARRIEAHRASRPGEWTTVKAGIEPAWLAGVAEDAVLVLDCLGTLVSHACYDAVGELEIAPAGAEEAVGAQVDALLRALLARAGDTIVVTNETGWGVVPAWPSARIFRDELGRANRRLVAAADAAYLVVDGRCLDLKSLPERPAWPSAHEEGDR
ncbi:MAG TPA: bifunctional adenosylcobinamide kinase/adenosylcobinamide-phosphate guanylyltransferase [Cellulomonas sp.]